MNTYLMKRNDVVNGPFSLEVLKSMNLLASDLFSPPGNEPEWKFLHDIPELSKLYLYPEEISSKQLPGIETRQPQRSFFRKWFSETEFRTRFLHFLNRLQTARVTALFVIMLMSTLFAKLLLDRIVADNFEYTRSVLLHPPVAKGIKAGKNFHTALVKTYIHPDDTARKIYKKPARPKDVFKLVEVSGRSFPADDPDPTSLLITVRNHSQYLVDNAEVEVEYRTRQKSLIQTYQFKNLSPLGSKTMSVPVIKQYATVKYRVLNIYTRQFTALQRDL